jgi:hypothetical protein
MVFEIQDRSIEEILKTLVRLVVSPDELEHWTRSIETTAKVMSNDEGDKIDFEYFPAEKLIKFFIMDAKARDNLVNSIEIHFPLIPESLQGFQCIQV